MIIEKLKTLKNQSNITVSELSNLSGIPVATIRRIFSGDTPDPRFDTVVKLVTAMGGSLDDFVEAKEIDSNPKCDLKESFCDIDDYYQGESQLIVPFLSQSCLQNANEIACVRKYHSLWSAYNDKKRIIRTYISMITENEGRIKKVNKDGQKDRDNITRVCIRNICSYQSKIDEESAYLKNYENELAKLELSKPIQNILLRENNGFEEIKMTFAKFTIRVDEVKIKSTKTKSSNKTNVETKQRKYYTVCGTIGLILGVLYLVGMADLDYGYYNFLRLFSFLSIPTFIYSYWHIREDEDLMKIDVTHIITGLIWVLFNPVLPIYLSKNLWVFFDFISAMVFLGLDVYLIVLYRRENV